MDNKIIIVGAGLCGSLLALRMAMKGYSVVMDVRRPGMLKCRANAARAINLALSDRGLLALELAGIKDDVLPLIIPMHGRMIHSLDGGNHLVNYS